jgi:hypothetical protein
VARSKKVDIKLIELTVRLGDPTVQTFTINVDKDKNAIPEESKYVCTGIAGENVDVLRAALQALIDGYFKPGVQSVSLDVSKYEMRKKSRTVRRGQRRRS